MSDLSKYMKELDESTSGGSHDAVVFLGKGIEMLKSMTGLSKKASKKQKDEDDDDQDDNRLEDDDDDDDDDGFEKNDANGGDLEDEDEDLKDPADDEDDIFTNHGVRIPKSKLKGAVSKNYQVEERRFQKSLDEMLMESEEVIDAVPAVEALAKSVRSLGKSTNAGFEQLVEQNKILSKGLKYAMQAIAGLASDLETVKKQPVSTPNSGVFMAKNAKDIQGGKRRLSKSEVEDVLTDALNEGLINHMVLAKAAVIRDQAEFDEFVGNLPEEVQARLNA